MKNFDLHGCRINHEDDVKDIHIYLENHLDEKEFHTLFDHAKLHQQAFFQDESGHHYVIDYKNGEYFIIKR